MLNSECEVYQRRCLEVSVKNQRLKVQLKEMVSEMVAEQRGADARISFQNFHVGSIAMFIPWSKQTAWVAFNLGAKFRILPPERVTILKQKNSTMILGVITSIVKHHATVIVTELLSNYFHSHVLL